MEQTKLCKFWVIVFVECPKFSTFFRKKLHIESVELGTFLEKCTKFSTLTQRHTKHIIAISFRDFQPITFALDDNSLLSDQNTNRFLV